jgi:two-component system, OmpR family, alkaline phosphatase synthesis response regulator PhoP
MGKLCGFAIASPHMNWLVVDVGRGVGAKRFALTLPFHLRGSMNKKVLVIEDEESIREYMVFILENDGFIVSEAKNGIEGLERFSQQDFDLVITDMVMPGMNGLKIMELIRKIVPEAAVIAISGAMSYSDLLSGAGKYGADAVVQKPFTELEILKTVRSCLNKIPKNCSK